jgi:hypothetical protein
MQTLNISETEVRSESRIKSLFWPSITSGTDVDYLGAQGYWVCAVVAALSSIFLVATNHAILAAVNGLFYYLGGIGVRERSRYAAAIVFIMYFADTILLPGILKFFFCVLLFSNLRATWIASGWKPESEEAALPQRFNETWSDKFVDQFPMWFWPKIRIAYYIFSAGFFAMAVLGLTRILLYRLRGY